MLHTKGYTKDAGNIKYVLQLFVRHFLLFLVILFADLLNLICCFYLKKSFFVCGKLGINTLLLLIFETFLFLLCHKFLIFVLLCKYKF